MLRKCWYILLVFALSGSATAHASDFGTVGIITLPTARLMVDGDLSATISTNQVAAVYNVSYQVAPFLESTFRYTVFNPYGRDFSVDDIRDRSLEVKLRLLKETPVRPQIAIGLRDILGTGVLGAEYFVASKRLGALDLSAGWHGGLRRALQRGGRPPGDRADPPSRLPGNRGLGRRQRANCMPQRPRTGSSL